MKKRTFYSRIMNKCKKIFLKLFNTIYCIIHYKRNEILLVNCWIDQSFGKLRQRNFGDELNVYLIEGLTGKKVINANNTLFRKKRISIIGSIVESYSSGSEVWGSGAIEGGGRELVGKPKRVCAVRGKLTQEYLINNNVHCPNVYGDPALLLPRLYNPKVEKKYRVGLIPHFTQLNHPLIQGFFEKYKNELLLIRFEDYGDWHNIINQIKSCEKIISSSLHGIIISDAYGIPNVWIKVATLVGDEFKFRDYFSGVNREYIPPYVLEETSTLDDLSEKCDSYKPIEPDIEALIKSSPFEIKI